MTIANEVHDLIEEGLQNHYSDLFFKPLPNGWQLLGRNIQSTTTLATFSAEQGKALLNFFKFQAQMDLSEHRRPQIGAWHYQNQNLNVDLRLACVGDYLNRESLVIRLLNQAVEKCEFINPARFQELTLLLKQRGLLLFSGPTGSGKTTLMYNLARELIKNHTILSIEDPTEIVEPGFIQLQVNEEAQMTYANLLKISLRLRPDILIIGEIRDQETADIAIQAALSGHLVLATIHARSSNGVIERLLELNINQSALLNALTASCYQRLIPVQSNNSNQSLRIALDILANDNLANTIRNPTLQMENWWNDLQDAQQNGAISNQTLQKFRWG